MMQVTMRGTLLPCKLLQYSPHVLQSSLQKQIIPSFDFFVSLFQSEDKFIKALKRFSSIFVLNTDAVPNIKVLIEVGVPEWNIVKLLQRHPRALTKKRDLFKKIVAEVKVMRFNALTGQFLLAVATLTRIRKSTWERKADLYKRWGWSDDDILAAFGRFPHCMAVSEDKIEMIMDFFVNQMGCESSTVAIYPQLLGLSLKKRIVPRASVIQVLLSKGFVKQLVFPRMFYASEKVFLDKFIACQGKEADQLLKLYQAIMEVEQKIL
ncbi:hypothetical protein L6164_029941 [Bauhinia variegata]|uniref:Uncharacterized protein n=1 Tax=Bauhinia variegata TaxID=167791 RepID=A0ACB9LA90_BAUVA|nr:hypothetical protein L6164_029941 [Bauhinia variegata]